MKLTKPTVTKLALPPGKNEIIVFDEDMPGFGLRLRAGGSAVWVAQYRVGAKQRRVTLGKLATLAHAEKAHKAKTHRERTRYLNRDWKPFHARSVHEIDRREVAARLHVLAAEHGPVAANRARATLSAFYAWAIGHGVVDANPVIGTVPPGVERSRERVLAAMEVREVWDAAGNREHGLIVKLLLLTGQRRGEVAGMKWGELDLDRAMWSLPPERTKNGLPHDVPLSLQAVAILRSIKARDGRELLFGHAEGPFSDWSKSHERINARIACRRAEARLGRSLEPDEQPSVGDAIAPWTLHDLRRTVVTGMNELGIQPHVVEAVVNHVSGRAKAGVAGVYNRATYTTEKRMALQAWADHLDQLLGLGERRVIPMRT